MTLLSVEHIDVAYGDVQVINDLFTVSCYA